MRGDNSWHALRPLINGGSPPHAWGQFFYVYLLTFIHRLTPTCVGTINPSCRIPRPVKAHPHMRGDNYANRLARDRMSGSPPHAWGQWGFDSPRRFKGGLTPTCVGTIPSWQSLFSCCQAHPHMRGDNLVIVVNMRCISGSPPHAWGQ